jgi:hypothetical protein
VAQRDEVCELCVVEPAAAFDELVAEVADMRDRPTETGAAETQKHQEEIAEPAHVPVFINVARA